MVTNQIPERLINFRGYREGNHVIGMADVTLPAIEAMTETLSGSGIAGELETPVLGHFKSMTTTIKWRTIAKEAIALGSQVAHQITFRGSMQLYDAGTGKYKTSSVVVEMKNIPKKITLGNFQTAKPTDGENEFEVIYLKLSIDGEEVLEIDKLNFICSINGTDILQTVREDLGY
ncbi:phage major tail tube protein [Yersinia mollaretii]|uniref:phage major tail tube protein n=1 Tax=Yersinia mollaretii TaxID=33060 RepID=UPI0021BD80DD|nr:phage major tail tube protein [Yersinia mollaretii]